MNLDRGWTLHFGMIEVELGSPTRDRPISSDAPDGLPWTSAYDNEPVGADATTKVVEEAGRPPVGNPA